MPPRRHFIFAIFDFITFAIYDFDAADSPCYFTPRFYSPLLLDAFAARYHFRQR